MRWAQTSLTDEAINSMGLGLSNAGVVVTTYSRKGRNLESTTTKAECTLKSKSRLESVAASTPVIEAVLNDASNRPTDSRF